MMNSKSDQEMMRKFKELIQTPVKEAVKEVSKTFGNKEFLIQSVEVSTCYPSEFALKIIEGHVLAVSDLKHGVGSKITILSSIKEVKAILSTLLETESNTKFDEYEISIFSELANRFTTTLLNRLGKSLHASLDCTPFDTIVITQDRVGFTPFESRILSLSVKIQLEETSFDLKFYIEQNVFTTLLEAKSGSKEEDIKIKEVRLPKFVENNDQLHDSSTMNNLDLIMNVPLKVSIVIGQAKKKVKEIMSITSGYVIELDKQIGAPVDIVVNDQPLAKGEVVVIDENFAIRITEIVNVSNLATKD